VIGGGPAGATLARRLARLGHDVVLIERSIFPRRHVGESLPPSIIPILDLSGVRRRVETAGFLRPASALVRWSGSVPIRRWYGGTPGFQVDRGGFDQVLLEAAGASGVAVYQPAQASRPVPEEGGWRIPVRSDGPTREICARFLVDAAGKHAAFSRRRRGVSVPTVAMYGYWYETDLRGSEMRVEAGRSCWYWGAPLPDGSFNAAVFVDAQRCAGLVREDLDVQYRARLAESHLLRGCIRGVLREPVRICDASTYFDDDPVTPTSIRVGEAAFAIDPLSSQGVQVAMTSAFQAAAVVHTLRCGGDQEAALEFYRRRQRDVVEGDQRIAERLYAAHETFREDDFWRSRARDALSTPEWTPRIEPIDLSAPLMLSFSARVASVPTIEGDFIRRSEALHHPSLEGPVAYLGDIALAPLLRQIGHEQRASRVAEEWSRILPAGHAWRIIEWLWRRRILEPTDSVEIPCH